MTRVQNRAVRKSNGVALGQVFWILERQCLMIELENLNVDVAMFFEEIIDVCGFENEFAILFGSGEEVVIGVQKGGCEMGKWRYVWDHDLKKDDAHVKSASM